ncbi:MAG: glucose-1-phosphate adenylyltransferase, partial [Clostridia bacterium]|nr:glucose-1-phosphate adenylyltransferase [Clostridia bacterium]
EFSGYWKDVGTIASLWEANMEILGEKPAFSLNDEDWRIYSRHEAHSPQYVGPNAKIDNSTITEGCEIYGTVKNSVLGAGVCVMEGAVVENSVIMEAVVIDENAKINYSIIDECSRVGKNCRIGKEQKKAKGITVIASGLVIPDNTEIGDNQMISDLSDITKKEEN